LTVLIVVVVAAIGLVWLGQWLVVEDALVRTHAIVVLGGSLPSRAIEAARLYRDGWASEVWVTRGARFADEAAVRRLGIDVPGEEFYSEQVLQRLGVPKVAIRLLDGAVQNTAEELRLVGHELEGAGGGCVILVTSKPHTRRVRVTWKTVVGDTHCAVIRYATDEPFDERAWWRRRVDALAVSREILGLANAWAGFPIR
jgi:uncharacterized SAM-binding protein YcdF (DUF218 family)